MASKTEWLLTANARSKAAEVRDQLLAKENILRILKRLRKSLGPDEAAMTMELANLQLRARAKFSRADQMLFTRTSLEQATSERLAQYKASRFPESESIADICCGIGGDALGLGQRHSLGIVDQQPFLCRMAEHNLRVYEVPRFSVFAQSFSDFDIVDYDCLHFDPDRRVAGRTVLPNDFSPSLDEILRGIGRRLTAIKLAPATNLPHAARSRMHREWIGERREAKQQVVWLNHANYPPGLTTCTVVTSHGVEQMQFENDEQFRPATLASGTGTFVFEPHACVIAARMVSGLARRLNLSRIGPGAAYLTGDQPIDSRLVSTFLVQQVVPLHLEAISNTIRQNQYGEIEWKKRAVEQETYEQLRRLKTRGDKKVTAIVTPSVQGPLVIFCDRQESRRMASKTSDQANNDA